MEGFVLGQDVPDRLGQLSSEIDPGDLRAALPTEACLRPLIALPIVGVASGMGRGFDQGPAQVLGPVLGQGPTPVLGSRLADERAQPGVPGELLSDSRTG